MHVPVCFLTLWFRCSDNFSYVQKFSLNSNWVNPLPDMRCWRQTTKDNGPIYFYLFPIFAMQRCALLKITLVFSYQIWIVSYFPTFLFPRSFLSLFAMVPVAPGSWVFIFLKIYTQIYYSKNSWTDSIYRLFYLKF